MNASLFIFAFFLFVLQPSTSSCEHLTNTNNTNTNNNTNNNNNNNNTGIIGCVKYAVSCRRWSSINGTNTSSLMPCCSPTATCSLDIDGGYLCIEPGGAPPRSSTCKKANDRCDVIFPIYGLSFHPCCDPYHSCQAVNASYYRCKAAPPTPPTDQCIQGGDTCYPSSSTYCCGDRSCQHDWFHEEYRCYRSDAQQRLTVFLPFVLCVYSILVRFF